MAATNPQEFVGGPADNECRRCGSQVSQTFGRVLGSNENVVYACPDCATKEELDAGAAARPDGGVDDVE